ncbi:MAG: hypothetical protein FJW98_05510 [Actinobacteria bacterium]|nr:hypothetical protein [Actinomycetota bacterium]
MRGLSKRRVAEVSEQLRLNRQWQRALAACCAVFVALIVMSQVLSQQKVMQRWATTQEVLVATSDISPGETLTPENTMRTSVPQAITPRDALVLLTSDKSASALIVAGQVISKLHVGATATLTPEGWKTVALPDDVMLPLSIVGAKVDVVVETRVVVNNAILVGIATDTHNATIAVPEQHAPAVAIAAQQGTLTLVGSS